MNPKALGACAEIIAEVAPEMTARLLDEEIHPVYSTFWLAYHAECAARKAIEPYFEPGENAVGAALELKHEAMAPVGARVRVVARVADFDGKRVVCFVEAFKEFAGQTTRIAFGTQTQIVLPQSAISALVSKAYSEE